MRAVRVHELKGLDALRVEETPSPRPGPGQVRIAMHAAACNFPDLLMLTGVYQFKPTLPFTPGIEGAGEIVEVGDGVEDVKPGDRVLAVFEQGAFAEEAIARAVDVIAMPDNMEYVDAAGFSITYMTSYCCLHHKRVALLPGEVLLVHGAAGGVGLTTVEVGKIMGATVVATASTDEKLRLAREYGADHLVNTSTEDIRERVKALAGGADVVFDPVGGDLFRASLRCVNPDARLVIIGFAGGEIQQVPANHLLVKNVSAVGFAYGAYRRYDMAMVRRCWSALTDWYRQGRLRPHVGRVFALEDAAEALAVMRDRKAMGKIVLKMR